MPHYHTFDEIERRGAETAEKSQREGNGKREK
jgi:hypothetical protein